MAVHRAEPRTQAYILDFGKYVEVKTVVEEAAVNWENNMQKQSAEAYATDPLEIGFIEKTQRLSKTGALTIKMAKSLALSGDLPDTAASTRSYRTIHLGLSDGPNIGQSYSALAVMDVNALRPEIERRRIFYKNPVELKKV
jgi:hypothetical protein